MPELPEVETTVQGLKRYAEGQRIEKTTFYRSNIRYPLEAAWLTQMTDQQIVTIKRRAKLIIMQLSDDSCLLWHLGMTGSMRVSQADEPKRKHDHVECLLSDGRLLRFHDPRRFGYLKYFPDEAALYDSISHYGFEPLSADFTGRYLWEKSRQKKQSVKNFIMDQSVVVGVGNIYACEALFSAGIRPQKPCGKISLAHYTALVEAIKGILKQAIEQGGTTLKDFENAEAKPGYFQQSLSVYGRADAPCLTCQTPIKNIKLGGRSSFYCTQCQR